MTIPRLVATLVFALIAAPHTWAQQGGDAAAIAAAMRATFERPDAPLDAGPVVVSGTFAVADWTQGGMGGRALYERADEGWVVRFCSGDALRTAEGLQRLGVPYADAVLLEARLAEAERAVAPDRLAAMAAFDGTVAMGGAEAAPNHSGHTP